MREPQNGTTMSKYRLDIYKKLSSASIARPIFFRSQFITAKNMKDVAIAISTIGNYEIAPPESEHNFVSEDGAITVRKFNKKLDKYL
jgi:hypothetical protein